jgi:hypothetical protein
MAGTSAEMTAVTARAAANAKVNLTAGDRDRLISAVLGLTLDEAERVFAQALVRDAKLDASDIDAVLSEKKQIIRKSGLLEYYTPDEGLKDIGGLDLLKDALDAVMALVGIGLKVTTLPMVALGAGFA